MCVEFAAAAAQSCRDQQRLGGPLFLGGLLALARLLETVIHMYMREHSANLCLKILDSEELHASRTLVATSAMLQGHRGATQ